jgi:hypothetical protein
MFAEVMAVAMQEFLEHGTVYTLANEDAHAR